jgi:hypothetical protein
MHSATHGHFRGDVFEHSSLTFCVSILMVLCRYMCLPPPPPLFFLLLSQLTDFLPTQLFATKFRTFDLVVIGVLYWHLYRTSDIYVVLELKNNCGVPALAKLVSPYRW